jgi:hypothetical protein
MAGSITVSSITLDSDNNFSIKSNTGATILSANGTGLITGIASGSAITNAQLTTPTVSGNAAFDTNTLFVDATNDRVGIGTSTPAYTFDVTTPTTVLGRFQSTHSTGGYLYFQASGTTPTATGYIGAASKLNSGGANTDFGMTAVTNLVFGTNDGTERMRIDSSGRVTMPYQPCFHVRVNNGSYITTSPIPFSNAPINVGSHFNTSTYKFTAPIAGKYYFVLMLYVRLSGSGDVTSFVRVNDSNRQYLNYIIGSSTTEYNSITMPSIFNLSAGDTVDYTFTNTNGAYYGGNSETNLFGWLLG